MSDPEQSSTSHTRHVWRKTTVGSSSNAREDKKAEFQHSKCKCETYAIMQEFVTSKNPDRIFLGCSYYHTEQRHYNYFVWLDELISKYFGHEDDNDDEGRMMILENRLEQLKYKIELENEKK
ncbi:uncharacterized protein DS421_9g277570 [Arachis hypogaea]|uniref:Zinc finger GRF-type domain-containing protein n=1 Tax=Arachis hypogaea TaxID=3818 RepID=A0A444ZUC7_ARAHY|nr:uncharacterized protein DS421_9g277570 [Arachis hypogaea]RYR17654.1 hypothetical protein Ahy_B03g062355 [Arachis hypogaea]